jgi:hypothetical protein
MGDDAGRKLTKYLTQSRTKVTRTGGGELYQPEARLEELAGHGTFLEYWHAALEAGAPAAAEDGYVLDKRHESAAPLVRAEGGLSNGVWTVVLSRPLVVSKPHRKDFVEGKTPPFGPFTTGTRRAASPRFVRARVRDPGQRRAPRRAQAAMSERTIARRAGIAALVLCSALAAGSGRGEAEPEPGRSARPDRRVRPATELGGRRRGVRSATTRPRRGRSGHLQTRTRPGRPAHAFASELGCRAALAAAGT